MTSEVKSPAAEPGSTHRGQAAIPHQGEVVQPIVVNLGKQRRKRIKQLERGEGKLMGEIADALERVRAALGDSDANRVLVPVVFLYRRKRRRSRGLGLPFGL